MHDLVRDIEALELTPYAGALAELLDRKEKYIGQVDVKGQRYLRTFAELPELTASSVELNADAVRIGTAADLDEAAAGLLLEALKSYSPWRKGPFSLFGIDIDSEWVSSLKWDRVKDHIAPLRDRKVLDVGSSSGYYMYRMAGEGARCVIGLEPYLTFYFQFRLLQHYARVPNVYGLPAKFEEMPLLRRYFDTIFCMGILYHRRSPIDALMELRHNLRRGGELVLETLIIEGEGDMALCPAERYAKMNNVYFLPTVTCLTHWLQRAGFENIRCIDITPTTSAEQRRTEWIQTESLQDFLHPREAGKTIEGYPAPIRAILLANAR